MNALRSFRRGRGRGRRLWLVGATLIAAVSLGVVFVAASGAAPPPACPTPGNFEIDGDMTQQTCATPADDWNTPGIGVQSTTQGGTYSTSGKDDGNPSTWTSSGATPDKTDFAQAYATSRVVGGDFYVFVAWERTSTTGTQGYAIEVDNSGANVSANGTPQPKRDSGGSVFYISSQGAAAPAFDSACSFTSQSNYGQTCVSSASAAGVTAAINSASMSDPLNHTTQPAGGFFEVALDITTLTGIKPSCPGPSAASVYLRSITGQTSNGNLKGYMAPLSVAPNSTCVTPPITTTATPGGSTNLAGTTQHDEVTVGTQAAPGIGSVKFFLCSPAQVTANGGDCSANGTQIGSAVTLDSNGQGKSGDVSGATTSTIGTYCWRAEFTPGPNDHHYLSGSHTNSDSECFTVIKASPTISTKASVTGDGVVGTDTTSDTATVSGGVNPGGSIQFSVTDPNGHKTTVGSPVTVNGDGSYDAPASVALTLVGTYTWSASYSGDSLNNGAVDNGANESVTSIKASPTVETKASVTGNGVVGTDSTSDTATISGGDDPTGTIQFSITDPNGHKTTVGSPVTVNGDGVYDAPSSVALTLVGTYTWSASYTGDSLNNGAVDNGDNESVTSTPAQPTITTTQDPDGGVIGATYKDKADLEGAVSLDGTGTITWTLYPQQDCKGTPLDTETSAGLSSNGVVETPTGVQLQNAGDYYWVASFSGDSNNAKATSGCNDEKVVVRANQPTITTVQNPDRGVIGATYKDKADLEGGASLDGTGTITWTLYPQQDCKGTPVDTETSAGISSNGVVETPTGVQLQNAGDYYWVASFGGDSNNAPVASGCNDEKVVVSPNQPTITTTQDPKSGSVGDTFKDKATLSGAVNQDGTGTITWKLYSQPDCKGTPLDTESVSVDANGTFETKAGLQVNTPGTYYWVASFSGDSNNLPASSGCNDEPVVVNGVDLSVTKSGSPATQTLGDGNITWTIVVTNNGPGDDKGVVVSDPMPGGNTFVSVTTTKGSCTGGAILNCTIGPMAAKESVTITLVTTPSTVGDQVNTVNVVGDRPETNTANNTATATVVTTQKFTPPPVYCVAVSKVTPKQLFVGRKTKLTIRVTQHGKAVKGVHVRIKGPKVDVRTKASNGKGVITRRIKLTKAGILVFSPIASKRCNTQRVGVTNVFTPPVTG